MKRKRIERKTKEAQAPPWVRASISFPPGLYDTMQNLAKRKKVSLAWIVRDAAEKYVDIEAKEGRAI